MEASIETTGELVSDAAEKVAQEPDMVMARSIALALQQVSSDEGLKARVHQIDAAIIETAEKMAPLFGVDSVVWQFLECFADDK